MTNAPDIEALLQSLTQLESVLADLNVKWVSVSANGHWSFEKLGRVRSGDAAVDAANLAEVVAALPEGEPLAHSDWALRRFRGVGGYCLLAERLPVAVVDRLPQEVLVALKKQVRAEGAGMVAGQPGSGKSALLLWLALQLPEEAVVYIAENPPKEFPGKHVMHVFPPSTLAERRNLERLIRLAPSVLWDRISRTDDLLTLFTWGGAKRRWFTIDVTSTAAALFLANTARRSGADLELSTVLTLANSVIGRPEAKALAIKGNGAWEEIFTADSSILDLLGAFESPEAPHEPPERKPTTNAATEAETPSKPEPADEIEPADPFGIAGGTDAEDVPPAAEDSHPLTVPVELSEVEDSDPYQEDAVTGMLAKEESRNLRDHLQSLQDDPLAGGPQFEKSEKVVTPQRKPGVPDTTHPYLETPREVRSDQSGEVSYMDRLGIGAVAVEDVNLSDLRITAMDEVDEADLEIIEDVEVVANMEPLSDRNAGDLGADLDFESLADEMLSEISEIEPVGDLGTTNPAHHVPNHLDGDTALNRIDVSALPTHEPPPEVDSSPTMSASADILRSLANNMASIDEVEEATQEISVSDKLRLLRARHQHDSD